MADLLWLPFLALGVIAIWATVATVLREAATVSRLNDHQRSPVPLLNFRVTVREQGP